MKKSLAIVLAFVVLVTSFNCISVLGQEIDSQGLAVELNGVATGYATIVYNDIHYVPLRKVFEELGARVYYRNRDKQILALSRDGDMISHIVGENIITVNGEQREFDNPSVLYNDGTYISIDMVASAFCTDGISYEDQKLNIQKFMFNNDYHKVVKEVLDVADSSNFYPERFHRYINLHVKNPAYTMQEVLYRVNLGLDYPFYENIVTIEQPYELLVLVNKYNKLPEGYQQYNLVPMERAYTDGGNYLLAGVAYEMYTKMSDAAKSDGYSMRVISAYRTEGYQGSLYNNRVRTTGKINADNYSARPGHSEHQTGLAVDISSTRGTFEYTPEFKWLQQHAHEYGFIMRYPRGKEWITGYSYEPWHYRYVGIDAATVIHEEGITYEEYYAMYVSENEFR